MPLDASEIAALVFTDHLAVFPDSLDVRRQDPNTGELYVPAEAFIQALVGGLVAALGSVQILDKGDGEDNTPGTADPVSFSLPGSRLAENSFKVLSGWDGEESDDVIAVFIGSVLGHVESRGLLQMSSNANMGTGSSIVSPESNPNLDELMYQELRVQMPLSFLASGKFGDPVNKVVLDQIDNYCRVYADVIATLTATVEYTASGSGSAVSNVINTGSVI